MKNKIYAYIYNPDQKRFYVQQGCKLIDSDIHHITRKTFWVFNWNEVQPAYKEWVKRKH